MLEGFVLTCAPGALGHACPPALVVHDWQPAMHNFACPNLLFNWHASADRLDGIPMNVVELLFSSLVPLEAILKDRWHAVCPVDVLGGVACDPLTCYAEHGFGSFIWGL